MWTTQESNQLLATEATVEATTTIKINNEGCLNQASEWVQDNRVRKCLISLKLRIEVTTMEIASKVMSESTMLALQFRKSCKLIFTKTGWA